MTTAACVIIGDEILTGKVRDTNAAVLIDALRAIGVALRRLVTISDAVGEIAEEVRRCADRHDYVFTSGGVGPTHDDRTMEGIALGFGVRVVRDPTLEAVVREHWRERTNDAVLKMTEVPEGARLVHGATLSFPAVVFRNVYILPGVPQLFVEKLRWLGSELRGAREELRSVYTSCDESEIAESLSQVEAEHPGVRVGSYPRLGDPDHRVRLTLEGSDAPQVERALARLLELLPPGQVLRVEG